MGLTGPILLWMDPNRAKFSLFLRPKYDKLHTKDMDHVSQNIYSNWDELKQSYADWLEKYCFNC